MIEEVAFGQVFIPLTVGGGVPQRGRCAPPAADAGADKASINTAAVTNPDLINEASGFFGSQAIVVAIDTRTINPENTRWEVFTHGGRKATGINTVEWALNMQARGARARFCSPAWIETAPKSAFRFGAHPRRRAKRWIFR